ncbi:MAG: YbhB/YbcL family Raf kinase inhibitor-like protein [Oscillospiraceae bacterium]
MKRFLSVICIILVATLALCSCSKSNDNQVQSTKGENKKPSELSTTTTQPQKLKVKCSAIEDGKISDEYGKRGTQIANKVPTRSIPLTITTAPSGTVCFAIAMSDPDSKPVCGYEWVHWLATNIEPKEIPANASIDMKSTIIQGKNSFGTIGYGGPTPPDKAHNYVITIYALDAKLPLSNGYSLDEFNKTVKAHTIDSVTLNGSYEK